MVACVAMGILGAYVEVQGTRLSDEKAIANSLKTSATVLQSRDEDVGRVMADAHTRFIHLVGSDGTPAASATAAWNQAMGSGFLFCDQLPAIDSGLKYQVWMIDSGNEAVSLGVLDAQPGVSVYDFHPGGPIGVPVRIEVTAGGRRAGKPPVLTGIF